MAKQKAEAQAELPAGTAKLTYEEVGQAVEWALALAYSHGQSAASMAAVMVAVLAPQSVPQD